jgi:hypothetical protein
MRRMVANVWNKSITLGEWAVFGTRERKHSESHVQIYLKPITVIVSHTLSRYVFLCETPEHENRLRWQEILRRPVARNLKRRRCYFCRPNR